MLCRNVFVSDESLRRGTKVLFARRRFAWTKSHNIIIDDDGTTLDLFCKEFLFSVEDDGRRVIDKTGLTGKYTIHLEFASTEAARNDMITHGITPGDPTAPEIFAAIQEQLGLKLVPDKGPGDFLVIDHIEEPTPNGLRGFCS